MTAGQLFHPWALTRAQADASGGVPQKVPLREQLLGRILRDGLARDDGPRAGIPVVASDVIALNGFSTSGGAFVTASGHTFMQVRWVCE
jgi:hypothetical protein